MSITHHIRNFKARIPLLIFIALISVPSSLFAQQAPGIEWQKCFGGSDVEDADPIYQTIVQTYDGGYAIAGRTSSRDGDVTGIHGGNFDDIWVVKLNSSGSIQWQKCYGGTGSERADCIIQTSDKGYAIAGFTNSQDGDVSGFHSGTTDAWVIKLDSTGNLQWQKCLGGNGDLDIAHSIIQTFDGGYAIAGQTNSHDEGFFNHGNTDAYIVKLRSSGELDWQKCFGGINGDVAYGIIQTSDSGYVFAGATTSDDGDVLGLHGDVKNFIPDAWVVKLSASGLIERQKCLGGTNDDALSSILRISGDDLVLAGITKSNDADVSGNHGGTDVWVLKLDSSFNIIWEKCFGGTSNDYAVSIIRSDDGGYAFVGTTFSNDGDVSGFHKGLIDSADVWLVKLDSSGKMQWQMCLGGTGHDEGFGICQAKDGGYAIDGRTNSTNNGDVSGLHIGGHSTTPSFDIWVAKLKPAVNGVENENPDLQASKNSLIYPNPSSDQVHLQLPAAQIIKQVEFYDMLGRKLFPLFDINGNIATVDVHDLVPATYIARVSYLYNNILGIYTVPFIVQH